MKWSPCTFAGRGAATNMPAGSDSTTLEANSSMTIQLPYPFCVAAHIELLAALRL
jgi:hypothetical protein